MTQKQLKILALEPFYGGSHRAALDAWQRHSRHQFEILSLPDSFWRWRMRQAAMHFAEELTKPPYRNCGHDVIFCSEMVNLPEFLGLAPRQLRQLPTVVYFHENQLVYPVHDNNRRDHYLVLSNLVSALAADEVWFNSTCNRDTLLDELPGFFKLMPDHQPLYAIERVRSKSHIMPLGIESAEAKPKPAGPPHILWAARWEDDKNPNDFFHAIHKLRKKQLDFKLSVIGETGNNIPKIFQRAKKDFAAQIINWGYVASRKKYLEVLADADIMVSTAIHEFFGISVLEAAAAGAFPVLPERLAYPEVIARGTANPAPFFYDGSAAGLAEKLTVLLTSFSSREQFWQDAQCSPEQLTRPYLWTGIAQAMDDRIQALA